MHLNTIPQYLIGMKVSGISNNDMLKQKYYCKNLALDTILSYRGLDIMC